MCKKPRRKKGGVSNKTRKALFYVKIGVLGAARLRVGSAMGGENKGSQQTANSKLGPRQQLSLTQPHV